MTNPRLPRISEATIRRESTPDSFARGQQYARRGNVTALSQRGGELHARVEGTEPDPYRVQVAFDRAGISRVYCTCPYDLGGWCKHIVATLLTVAEHPERVVVRPPLAEQLARLGADELRGLLLHLAEQHPDAADGLEFEIALLRPAAPANGAQPRRTPVDPLPIHQRVRAVLRDAEGDGDAAARELGPILRRAELFIQHGDGRSALVILGALTEELLEHLDELGSSGATLYTLLADLGEDWTEAVLSADLNRPERLRWSEQLGEWYETLEAEGLGETFAMAATAADQEWDDPRVRRALSGQIDARGLWDGEPPSFADELALVRLRVLERQQRYPEYLHLAEAEGQLDKYLAMLIRLGQPDRAVREAQTLLKTAAEALEVAEALRAADEIPEALTVAEHGLTLGGPVAPLAEWLADAAEAAGRPELALEAAQAALRSSPTLNRLLKVQELAGETWPNLRPRAHEQIRQAAQQQQRNPDLLDLLIHERLAEDAISYGKGWANDRQTLAVMDAALPTRPEWVAKNATSQAVKIADAGDSGRYGHALLLLQRARQAFHAIGREPEWQRQIKELRARHWQKYKLIALLNALEPPVAETA